MARGLAALSVAIYHFGVGQVLANATGWSGLRLISVPGADYAVPLFFCISGFCIHSGGLANHGSRGFVRVFFIHRFFRIYPPWLVALAISALVFRLGGSWPEPELILAHLTVVNGFFNDYRLNPVLWSVSVECFLYLLYPLWLTAWVRFGSRAAYALAFSISVVSCCLTARLHPTVTGPAKWFFLNVWFGWMAGALLAEAVHRNGLASLNRRRFWLAGVLVVSAHIFCSAVNAYSGIGLYLRLPVIICTMTWPLAFFLVFGEQIELGAGRRRILFMWNFLAKVGIFSYSLYLFHVPFTYLRFPISRMLAGLPLLKGAIGLIWFPLILAASWCVYHWVERPAIALGRRLGRAASHDDSS